MKSIFLISILSCFIFCTNNDKKEKQKAQRQLFFSPFGFLWLLTQRDLRESPRCGGYQIGIGVLWIFNEG